MSDRKPPSQKPAAPPVTPGYSGKPLAQKLGLVPGQRVRLVDAPADYWHWCAMDAATVHLVAARARDVEFIHVFATARGVLHKALPGLVAALADKGMLWISWPKKASGVATDIVEGTLRDLVLPLGLVDVKVCAVSEVWSGLKFLRRRTPR